MRAVKALHLQGAMTRRKLALASGFLVCAALLGATQPAHAWEWGWGPKITGSGNITTTSRAVTGFNGIDLTLPADLKIVQGSTEGLTIETDDNIAPLIETAVENGRLVIRTQSKIRGISTKVLRMTVHARTIDMLEVSGSGNISSDKLKSGQLKCSIAGSGDVRIGDLDAGTLRVSIAGSGDFAASGKADIVEASIAGSGDIKTLGLAANAVKVSIAGSGDAAVWAKKTLKVNIAGSGNVTYFGDAEVSTSIAGSGSTRHLGSMPAAAKP
jgi:hypothetical protein